MARCIVADYVGQIRDFRYFVEDAAAGELRPSHQVPLAILTPERRRQIGVGSREMPLHAGTEHSGAWHAWIRHGPGSDRPAWERLAWSDWLLVQRIVEEVTPVQQPSGRWRFVSGALRAVRNRPIGFVLVTEVSGDALTPVTFYRTDKIGR